MRQTLLILSIAFVVICYAYPCLVLPFGEYVHKETVAGQKIETVYEFKFNGTATVSVDDVETKMYYKLKGNDVILSEDKTFDDNDLKLEIKSLYNVGGATNQIGQFIAIGVGIMAIVLICTIPNQKKS